VSRHARVRISHEGSRAFLLDMFRPQEDQR
jgi:hypothetical protein